VKYTENDLALGTEILKGYGTSMTSPKAAGLIRAHVDAALAEREAQVRAEEREKVAGLVDALSYYADHGALGLWQQTGREDEDGNREYEAKGDRTSTFKIAEAALATYRANENDAATYNDNRKG
jgi:hypothetical protein